MSLRSSLGKTPLGAAYRRMRFDTVPQLRARISSKEREKLFRAHFESNHWMTEESRSGPGSTLSDTEAVRRELPAFLRQVGAHSLLDVPCGDWAWMKTVDLAGIHYIGADIVTDLVDNLNGEFASVDVEFRRLDVVSDELPQVDAILCRDLLIHLPNAVALKVLEKFRNSGAKWLLITTSEELTENVEIVQGRFRPVNLCVPPFNLPAPSRTIEEGNGGQADAKGRCLAIWNVADL